MSVAVESACLAGSGLGGRNSSIGGGTSGASPTCNQSVKPYSPEATAAFATAITLMVLFTIVGNILVIIAVLTSRSLRGPQNLFLVSLAAADILVATLIIPFSLANELMGYWYFRSVWCEIYLALDVLFCTSSIVHLCAISLDRYLSISRAVTYGAQRTAKRIKTAILVSQSGGGGAGLPQCQLNDERWYILYSTIGSFFAPCLIMILVYIRIYQIAKQRTRCPPGEPRKEGAAAAAAAIPQKGHDKTQLNGGADSTPAAPKKSSAHRPPNLAVPLSPCAQQARRSANLLQPPSPSPAPTPTTPCSPLGPRPLFDAVPHLCSSP
ncbi:hypothetical protein SKAU_G00000160 [Synaphobranchus kaupii]|uniref:Alpha-2B adrenergic receptor n=1 Tax=Synaphobranchus kaupii TaxID=118154 RepID=A0A9Q1G8W6_SYNKA|nr:hypothetical protein SKAU_G00000160 [Synaphobranchus kaupii]